MLAKYDCVLTPDFSTYTDMPTPMKLWNIYRSRADYARFVSGLTEAQYRIARNK